MTDININKDISPENVKNGSDVVDMSVINLNEKCVYSTGEVAQLLGVNEYDIRNAFKFVEKFLNYEKTVGSKKRFSQNDVDKFKQFFEIRDKHQLSNKATAEYLESIEMPLAPKDDLGKTKVYLEQMVNKLVPVITESVKEQLSSTQQTLLEDISRRDQELEKQTAAMNELKEKYDLLIKQNTELREALDEKDKQQELDRIELKKLIESQNLSLEELKKELLESNNQKSHGLLSFLFK